MLPPGAFLTTALPHHQDRTPFQALAGQAMNRRTGSALPVLSHR